MGVQKAMQALVTPRENAGCGLKHNRHYVRPRIALSPRVIWFSEMELGADGKRKYSCYRKISIIEMGK